jgi:hypothetical protein
VQIFVLFLVSVLIGKTYCLTVSVGSQFFLSSSDKERSVQMSRATSPQSVIVGRPPTNATLVARFCRERAPRTCEHALLKKSRACARTESFLSKGDSMTLELKLTQGTALK